MENTSPDEEFIIRKGGCYVQLVPILVPPVDLVELTKGGDVVEDKSDSSECSSEERIDAAVVMGSKQHYWYYMGVALPLEKEEKAGPKPIPKPPVVFISNNHESDSD
jgi:hypothetical protein